MEWIKCSERMPPIDDTYGDKTVRVLCYQEDDFKLGIIYQAYFSWDGFMWVNPKMQNGFDCNPTHWMPLPQTPKE